MTNFFIIRWESSYLNTFSYGSKIVHKSNGDVFFSSPLMPSGATIKMWKSNTQFHVDRESPTLPLLNQSNHYYIKLDTEQVKDTSIQIRLAFFDSEEELIEEQYFQNLEGHFIYPSEAVSYTIELINKHIQSLTFRQIFLMDYDLHLLYTINEYKNGDLLIFKAKKKMKNRRKIITFSKAAKNIQFDSIDCLESEYIFVFDSPEKKMEIAKKLYEKISKSKSLVFRRGQGFVMTSQWFQSLPDALGLLLNRDGVEQFNVTTNSKYNVQLKLLSTRIATDLILSEI